MEAERRRLRARPSSGRRNTNSRLKRTSSKMTRSGHGRCSVTRSPLARRRRMLCHIHLVIAKVVAALRRRQLPRRRRLQLGTSKVKHCASSRSCNGRCSRAVTKRQMAGSSSSTNSANNRARRAMEENQRAITRSATTPSSPPTRLAPTITTRNPSLRSRQLIARISSRTRARSRMRASPRATPSSRRWARRRGTSNSR